MQRLKIEAPPAAAQVAAVINALRAGSLVILPTETVYGFAADPRNPEAVARLRAIKCRDADHRFTHHLATAADLTRFAAEPAPRVRRYLERVWPGPLTAILETKDGGDHVGLRVPAHPFTETVLGQFGDSLFMTSVNRTGSPPCNDPDEIARAFGDDDSISILADAGRPRLGEASAVIRLTGQHLEILRTGILDEPELLLGTGFMVLFICTGNTCRSPLAEAIANKLVAERLGIEQSELMAYGLWCVSAGTGTLPGMPASSGSLSAGDEAGLDLSQHRTQHLTPGLIAECERIYCLSTSHRDTVIQMAPDAADRTFLLDPAGESVADPFGGAVEVYREIRDEIEKCVAARVDDVIALMES